MLRKDYIPLDELVANFLRTVASMFSTKKLVRTNFFVENVLVTGSQYSLMDYSHNKNVVTPVHVKKTFYNIA